MNRFPKRLIEVDLPVARISEHARKDKMGSISTLHIWWARRPLAACRAVICAALWPDPTDENCPVSFVTEAAQHLSAFANRVFPQRLTDEGKLLQKASHSTAEGLRLWAQWADASRAADSELDPLAVRNGLFNFIAEFAIRENSNVPAFLETSRALTLAAQAALSGTEGSRPLVADPFAGGGAIPLEALRVGADSFASDLNPVPVLLNRVLLEFIPRFGKRLPELLKHWGEWVGQQLKDELSRFYPTSKGQAPINYLWTRTIRCSSPTCGVEVPLMRSLFLSSKPGRQFVLRLIPNASQKRIDLQILFNEGDEWQDVADADVRIPTTDISTTGTVKGGEVTCPCCEAITPVTQVRAQLQARAGGSRDARLICVVTTEGSRAGKNYSLPTKRDIKGARLAAERLQELAQEMPFGFPAIPDEPTPPDGTGSKGGGYRTRKYGVTTYGDFFNARQLVQHLTISACLRRLPEEMRRDAEAADARSPSSRRLSQRASKSKKSRELFLPFESLEGQPNERECSSPQSVERLPNEEADVVQTLLALTANRQIDRDSAFCRWNPASQSSAYTFPRQAIPMLWDFVESPAIYAPGGWDACLCNTIKTIEDLAAVLEGCGSGKSTQASATQHPLPDGACSCIVTDPPYYDAVPYAELSDFFFVWLKRSLGDRPLIQQFRSLTRRDVECVVNLNEGKDKAYFQKTMTECLAEARRICSPEGLAVVVFAQKQTAGWETQLQAMLDAGWIVTASWPLDTEMANRLRALNSATLNASVHFVCRPRPTDASGNVGQWREVLDELPQRIREWMPRLAEEGVVGADAVFACLGPALEIFSRFSRVEKPNGEVATLKQYLDFVWAAISTEALALIFNDADDAGLEPDARLTAMWLWTVSTAGRSDSETESADTEDDAVDDDEPVTSGTQSSSMSLDLESATKIAQGLGLTLDQCSAIVEVKGKNARLLPVAERHLFKDADRKDEPIGSTLLDRVQQAMQLFGAARPDQLKQFLIGDGIGNVPHFWKLAQALSALYPQRSIEKRWVDGVLSRKKGLGF